ncbi:MAG TPA: hypothetical protein VFO46_25355 [Candidatus Sulfotelmatobacter sp.]|nr:hypothetical protein [Candidatus Sulfotelmatobacter sp.]
MKQIDFVKVLKRTLLATMLIGGCVSVVAQQQPPARPPVTRGPSPYGSAANAATTAKLPAGTITGFVYWQMNVFQPQADCQGLTVKIVTVTKSGMPLQLLSSTSTLTANGPVTDDSAQGAPKYMLCSYSFSNMPETVSVRALLYGQPTTTSVALPSAFQIPGGNCNSTPSGALSFILTGGPMLCGHGAFNINFKLTGSASAIARSPGKTTLIPNAGGPPHGLLEQPAPQNSNVSSPTSAATGRPTLLTSAPGTGSPTPSQSNNGARQSTAATTSGATSQTLTNADVARMLQAGLAESVIISSIRSAKKNFDFSPAGCQTLKRARVSAGILDAMGDGSTRPCNASGSDKTSMVPSEQKTPVGAQTPGLGDGRQKADGLNPQSGPQPSKTRDPEVLQLLQKPGTAKTGPVVRRPKARENEAITALLQKQRSAADAEVAQLKLRIQPANLSGESGSPSQLMSATGGSATSGQTPGDGGNPGTVQRGSSSGGSSGIIPPSIAHEHPINSTPIICSTDPTFRILKVSGSGDPATFTPTEQYNLYTITGCSFGDTSGEVSIYGTGSFQEDFIVKFWSENSIVVSLHPDLSGLPDLDNITLVVQRNDKQQTQKPGFKFYAARQTVPLKQIPSSWVRLEEFPYGAQYSSPPSGPGPAPNPGSAYVSRFIDGYKFDPSVPEGCGPGKAYCPQYVDHYDFSQLAPGWTTDSFQVTIYPQTCPFTVTYREDFGTWNWDWAETDSNNIRGYLSDTTCSGFFAGMPLKNYQNWTGSYYALQVWVAGPRGLDPFTNQLVSQ